MANYRASGIGFITILLWSLLALLTAGTAPVPPFQLIAICFSISGIIGLIWIIKTGRFNQLTKINWRIYAFGTAGLFGYHFLYFSALFWAPAAEAGLITYLWRLLIAAVLVTFGAVLAARASTTKINTRLGRKT